ncbi:16S rRNA (cytosine(967)-C(5))-methyltransferase RsmB [Hydrogenophaga sp. 5NK40-0174]|uniref:16S rRNA (cytosine(967)-C(5))-methyltransferase RsmB n=1 Tax=Hydrogenophaga sp. 5NK40-0174 TaxID=3127649 RepID=UPI003109BB1C
MHSSTETRSLAEQLHHCANCVRAVLQGQSLAEAMPKVPKAVRPGVQALTFRVMRRLGIARALMGLLVQRQPDKPTAALLLTGIVLLLDAQAHARDEQLEEGVPLYAAHTVVDQLVEAAKKAKSTRSKAPFLNGCLRRLMRENEALVAQAMASGDEAQWNHPAWWVTRLRQDYPEQWQQVLQADLHPGPMTLRVNRRKTSLADMQAAMTETGVTARPVGANGLVLSKPLPVERIPGFMSGVCSVQDAAAQIAAPLLIEGLNLRPESGRLRVLDACAAPGGKTAHLLELADLDVLALDVDPVRCERIGDNLKRLGLQTEVRSADAGDTAGWWDGELFDAILLDAPCSAAGIARRHPDVLWLRRDTDIAALAQQQKRLLDALWPLLRPGGRLVYATCSVFKAEGQEQADAFLGRHTDALVRPSPGHLLPSRLSSSGQLDDNQSGEYDGFFYACFDKQDASGAA